MNKSKTIKIDANFLNNKISRLGLKNAWLAAKIQVDPKTISRWLNGRVERMTIENANNLAKVLECSIEELTYNSNTYFLDTCSNKDEDIENIISEDLLQLLSPTGSWKLLESIIKSVISPNLKKDNIGKLYNWLSITKWRMKDYESGIFFAKKALEIGRDLDNKSILVKALFNLGTIDSIIGNHKSALNTLIECYKMKSSFSSTKDVASLCTNLSMVYRDFAEFDKSIEFQNLAIDLFLEENKYFNLSIAYHCLGSIYTEIGRFEDAIVSYDSALDYAEKSNYEYGNIAINIYKIDPLILNNNIRDTFKNSIDAFFEKEYADFACYEIIARYFRLTFNNIKAKHILEIGIKKCNNNSVVLPSLYHEMARIALSENDSEGEQLFREKGNDIYYNMGLINRVITEKIKEYGTLYR